MPVDLATLRELVGASPLFAGVSATAVDHAVDSFDFVELAPGEQIIAEGASRDDDDVGLYVLVDGQLLVTRMLPGGKTERLSVMAPGDFFGELARVGDGVRSATVSAVTSAIVGRLPGPAADRLLAEAPMVMRTIATVIARRLRAADEARLAARLNEERLGLIGKAAAMLAHDLRNPLGVVKSAASLIQDGINPGYWAARSARAADFMLAMVQDLLDFAKGERSYAHVPVRLLDVVQDIEEFGLTSLEANGKLTVTRAIGGDATVLGDRRALSRALLNIVKNAADAMETGGTLTFRTVVSDDLLRVSIKDTGPGIPEHVLPTLFEPFATHGKAHGTGLGLAMTKGAIEAHGGRIAVDTGQGMGTTFTVTLPLRA
jgi:signal transduction histidine kinase